MEITIKWELQSRLDGNAQFAFKMKFSQNFVHTSHRIIKSMENLSLFFLLIWIEHDVRNGIPRKKIHFPIYLSEQTSICRCHRFRLVQIYHLMSLQKLIRRNKWNRQ